jgi:hypothetical protein
MTLTMGPGPIVERTTQRRAAIRYKLQLPVIFHWNDGREHTEGDLTSDVAMDGALILCSGVPGKFCTGGSETNWYGRSLEWHEESGIHLSKL